MKSKILLEIYDKLFAHYGPQHWWPAKTDFEMMVGAILTQNTNWSNVKKAIALLDAKSLLEPASLHRISPEELAPHLKSAGYFNLKANRLKGLVHFLMEAYGADLEKMKQGELGALREQLLAVKGVGPETADSILLYGLGKAIFVIDQYTYRVLQRHHLIPEESDYESMQSLMMGNLPEDIELYKEYHALLVRVGSEFCKPKPKCELCPLKGLNW